MGLKIGGIAPGSLVKFNVDGNEMTGRVKCIMHNVNDKAIIFSGKNSYIVDVEKCTLYAAKISGKFFDVYCNPIEGMGDV